MTIDKAIKHCNEVVSEESCKDTASNNACGSEHKQPGIWLQELKELKEQKGSKMKRTNRSYLNNPYLKKPRENGKRERTKKEEIGKISKLQKWLDAAKNFFESILKKHV